MFNWLTDLLRRSKKLAPQAHLTFGQSSVGRTMSRTGVFLRTQLWIWPIVAVVLLSILGYGVKTAIERTIRESLSSQLSTLLHVEREMLENWLGLQERNAESLANDQQIRESILEILAKLEQAGDAEDSLRTVDNTLTTLRAALSRELGSGMAAHNFTDFVVVDKHMHVIATSQTELIGRSVPQHEKFLSRCFDRQPTVSTPYPSVAMVKDARGKMRSGVPTMFAAAPVRNANFQVIAAIAFRLRPDREFTKILQLGTIGKSGETYAFDKTGLLVTNSRFDEQLILLGLLPDTEDATSILTLSLRDPGGDMMAGHRPGVRRSELPLTKACASAISGESSYDVDGYRDYRGVTVVGAWSWLPKYDMGVCTEIDYSEAFRPLTILRWTFFGLFTLLGLSSVAIFVFTLLVARLRREAQLATIEAKQLGQYRLEEKIGAGAMGMVYRGTHAMMRRPTAIKLLNTERVNDASIARFEREVQITAQLNNPHTVAIYDYGRTPEGVFYYAMEYLDGIDLQALVTRYGPQPEARVVAILKQICSSLYEAHSLGLVHRDIKPANVMLTRRGGEPDMVKVLDFGLVKALDDAKHASNTQGGLTGTPLYMSPESIQTPDMVDGRSDLYAVGAVGYFLLTGAPVFDATSIIDLCQMHMSAVPASPAARLGRAVSSEIEHALLACLEKNRAKRPQTARDLATMLDRVPAAGWSIEAADAWWSRHERGQSSGAGSDAHAANPLAGSASSLVEKGRTAAGAFEATMDQNR